MSVCIARLDDLMWACSTADPFCSNTELEGGSSAEAVKYLSGVLHDLASDGSVLPSHAGLQQHVRTVCAWLEGGVTLLRCGLEQQLGNLRAALSALDHGDCVVIPAGWAQRDGGHAIMLVCHTGVHTEVGVALTGGGE